MARPPAAKKHRKSSRAWALGGAVLLVSLLAFWSLRGSREAPAQTGPAPFDFGRDADVFRTYAGSSSCRDCHLEAFNAWTNSHHALAERPLQAELDRPAFDPPRSFSIGQTRTEAGVEGEMLKLATVGTSGAVEGFNPVRVIGVDPLRQFLIPNARGRLQVTEVAVDSRNGEWFDVFGQEDRRPGEWGHWTGRGMTWNSMCASCHNTRLRKNYQEGPDEYKTTMAEMGVGCEACHGPMANHVAWQRQHSGRALPPKRGSDPTVVRFTRDQHLDACGSCHARRADLTGDFRPGDSFADHYSLVMVDDTDLYYPDGQVRDEDYEYASFLSSRMHAAGVRCVDCHEPHSGKTRASDNSLCQKCHGTVTPNVPFIDPSKHSFHKVNEPGDRCVDCHMPQTTYMQRHARRDHGFTIPDPLLTQQQAIPNACNRCHADKTVAWSLEWVEKWYGPRMNRPTRLRGHWIAQARAGHAEAKQPLLAMLRDEPIALWRAAAAGLLKSWSHEPAVRTVLLERLADADPLVRTKVIHALEPIDPQDAAARGAVSKRLEDPARVVRVTAAWALRQGLDLTATAGQDLLLYLRSNLDQPTGCLQMGVYYLDREQTADALTYLRRAVSWDPNSSPLRQALAVGLSVAGLREESVRQLEEACRLAPADAECQFKLGLAWNETGNLTEAARALDQAVKVEPQFGQAWYNLGLAHAALNRADAALEALSKAEALQPNSPQAPYAKATILAQLGRTSEARESALRVLAIAPNHSEALLLLQALGR